MATFSFSVAIAPPSPLVPSRRDLAVTQNDDVTLQLTIYDTDASTSAKNVTGGALRFRMFPAGRPGIDSEFEVAGTIVDAATGRMNVAITAAQIVDLAGEYRWQLRWSLSSAFTTICEGALHLRAEAEAA